MGDDGPNKFIKMKSSSSSMSSRSRKSKNQPKPNNRSSIDARPTTLNWNVNLQTDPRMRNLIKYDNKPYTITQTSSQGVIATGLSSGAVNFQKNYTAADIAQFASWSAVFDQYKIELIECWFTPFGPATQPGYNADVRFYSVLDYDDSNSNLTVASIQEYENCVTTRCSQGHYIKFRPHVGQLNFVGALPSTTNNLGLSNRPSVWLDAAFTNVQHFGIKMIIDPVISNGDLKVDLFTRITVSFKNVY